DHAETHRMMVASGDQRSPGGRTERGGMKLGVAQPRFGDAVQRRRRNDPAESAGNAVALVIGHDEQDVRRALWRDDARWPVRLGIGGSFLYHAAEGEWWWRDLFSVNRHGGIGRTGCAVDLLGPSGRRNRHDGYSEHPAKKDLSC